MNVLCKGLSFIPTPRNISHTPILEAAARLGRSLKIGCHFSKKKNKQTKKTTKIKLVSDKYIHKLSLEPSDYSIIISDYSSESYAVADYIGHFLQDIQANHMQLLNILAIFFKTYHVNTFSVLKIIQTSYQNYAMKNKTNKTN